MAQRTRCTDPVEGVRWTSVILVNVVQELDVGDGLGVGGALKTNWLGRIRCKREGGDKPRRKGPNVGIPAETLGRRGEAPTD